MGHTFTYTYESIDRIKTIQGAIRGDWLSLGENRALERFHDPSRRETWLAGRLLAKLLVVRQMSQFHGRYRDIEIHSAGSRPRVSISGRPLNLSISISHTQQGVLVALSRFPGISLGVDLVELCAYGEGFGKIWFTSAERRWLAAVDPCAATAAHALIWAIKEAVYKAANAGEPFDPRLIDTIQLLRRCRRNRLIIWRIPSNEIGVLVVVKTAPITCSINMSTCLYPFFND